MYKRTHIPTDIQTTTYTQIQTHANTQLCTKTHTHIN